MPNIFDHIKKVFTKSPLAGEDWLEPSDEVLSNIEAAISEDDKKNKFPFTLLLLSLILLTSIVFLVFFNPIYHKFSKENDLESSKTKIKEAYTQSSKSASEEIVVNLNETYSDLILSNPELTNSIVEDNKITNTISKIGKKSSGRFSTNEPSKIKAYVASTPNENLVSSITSQELRSNSSDDMLSIERVESVKENLDHDLFDDVVKGVDRKHAVTEYIPILSANILDTQTEVLPMLPVAPSTNVDIDHFQKQLFIETGAGFSFWNFRLNDAFKASVEPAAFEKSIGTGYLTSLRVGKNLNPRLSLSLQGRYEAINFSSGHNSNIVYDNNLTEQTENLTMATPLGLINNEIALFRTADVNAGQTNLIVDLENEHHLTALEFSLNANLALVQSSKLFLFISPGIGIHQILSTTNKLTSLNTNHTDIVNGGSLTEGDFESVRSTSPFTSLNISLQREIADQWNVGINIGSSVQLSPIQESMGLKTNVIRYNTQIVFRKNF